MLTELCKELKNWFDWNQPHHFGVFTIADGVLQDIDVPDGQYFRVIGSTYNDGVHQAPKIFPKDEVFDGAVWLMAVPPEVIALDEEIDAWRGKFEALDSQAMSPYQSESFNGYSYSKAGGGANSATATGGTVPGSWQSVFAGKLRLWRKI